MFGRRKRKKEREDYVVMSGTRVRLTPIATFQEAFGLYVKAQQGKHIYINANDRYVHVRISGLPSIGPTVMIHHRHLKQIVRLCLNGVGLWPEDRRLNAYANHARGLLGYLLILQKPGQAATVETHQR